MSAIWKPLLVTGFAHVAILAVPLQFADKAKPEEPQVVLRFKAPEPEPPPPPPEPPPVEEPPPEPPEPPPEPPPKKQPKPREEPPEPPPTPEAPPEPPPPPPIDPIPEPEAPPPPEAVTVPKPKPTKPPPKPGLSKADYTAYARGMRKAFLSHRRYPPAALRSKLEGVAKVKLRVDRRGRLVGKPIIVTSSGHAILDEEALRVVKASAPFDPLPANANKDVLVFVIPIDFRLKG